MPIVTVKVDADAAIRSVRGIRDDQIPAALFMALTATAKLAQSAVQQELPKRFTIRRLAWATSGIKIEAATKTNLVATVRDIHDYMALQDTGGEKLPHYGEYICVPLTGARRTPSSLIPDNLRPKAVMESGLGFIRGNIMYLAHFQRRTSRRGFKGVKGFSSGSFSREITPMYALVRSATIPARYGFEDIVTAIANAKFADEFGKAFQRAVATAR